MGSKRHAEGRLAVLSWHCIVHRVESRRRERAERQVKGKAEIDCVRSIVRLHGHQFAHRCLCNVDVLLTFVII